MGSKPWAKAPIAFIAKLLNYVEQKSSAAMADERQVTDTLPADIGHGPRISFARSHVLGRSTVH
jgi:hypothetical protein